MEAGYPVPNKTRIDAIPDETIAAALVKSKGLQYLAAEELDIYPNAVHERIKRSPYLQEVVKNCLGRRLDKAEFNLALMTEDKELGAICFLLKTRGKERGYVENKEETAYTPEQLAMMAQVKEFFDWKRQSSERNSCDNTSINE